MSTHVGRASPPFEHGPPRPQLSSSGHRPRKAYRPHTRESVLSAVTRVASNRRADRRAFAVAGSRRPVKGNAEGWSWRPSPFDAETAARGLNPELSSHN